MISTTKLALIFVLGATSCSQPNGRRVDNPSGDAVADFALVTSTIQLPASGLALTGDGQPVLVLKSAKGKVDGYHNELVALDKIDERTFAIGVPRRFSQSALRILEVSLEVDGSQMTLRAGDANPGVVNGIQLSFDGQSIQATSRKLETRISVRVSSTQKTGAIEIVGADSLCYDATLEQKLIDNQDIVEAAVKLGTGWSGTPVFSQPSSAIYMGFSRLSPEAATASWHINVDQLAIGSNLINLSLASENLRCDLEVIIEVTEEGTSPAGFGQPSPSPTPSGSDGTTDSDPADPLGDESSTTPENHTQGSVFYITYHSGRQEITGVGIVPTFTTWLSAIVSTSMSESETEVIYDQILDEARRLNDILPAGTQKSWGCRDAVDGSESRHCPRLASESVSCIFFPVQSGCPNSIEW
jgi:hypothetical protein